MERFFLTYKNCSFDNPDRQFFGGINQFWCVTILTNHFWCEFLVYSLNNTFPESIIFSASRKSMPGGAL
jgi:hypothetical protein